MQAKTLILAYSHSEYGQTKWTLIITHINTLARDLFMLKIPSHFEHLVSHALCTDYLAPSKMLLMHYAA
jgi:hypothetical protein